MNSWVSELWPRLRFFVNRQKFEGDLEQEIRFHKELRQREYQNSGIDQDSARYAAQRLFGNDTLLKEVSREMWGWRWLEVLLQDIRYGLRMLAKNPGVTMAVLLSLALGIGANTAIFSLLNAVVLKALPVERPEQLVQFSETYSQGDENSWIQIRRPTDDRWIRGKPLLPEAVAQHGHRLRWRSGELVVIRQDDAAGNRGTPRTA